MTLSLLILLMFNSVFPAMRTQSSSGLPTQEALVTAHRGEIIFAVHLLFDSLLTTNEMLENSPTSRELVELEPHSKQQLKFNYSLNF